MIAPVIVGYDASEPSKAAVEWGIAEARLRHRPLLILHAYLVPVTGVAHEAALYWPDAQSVRQPLRDLLRRVVAEVAKDAPDVTVTAEIVDSLTIASALIDKSRTAAIMVLGNRGRGGFAGLVLGSVSTQLASHAHCPVVVVRHRAETGVKARQVVVGVDGSDTSMAAVRFAFDEASRRGMELVAVHAWQYREVSGLGDTAPLASDQHLLGEQEAVVLSESLAGWQESYPDVKVTRRLVRGDARAVLLEEAAGAGLLVVGSRGRGGFTGLLLGSTSQAMLHHATAPVAVVRIQDDQAVSQ